jgi:hypothetical protein
MFGEGRATRIRWVWPRNCMSSVIGRRKPFPLAALIDEAGRTDLVGARLGTRPVRAVDVRGGQGDADQVGLAAELHVGAVGDRGLLD